MGGGGRSSRRPPVVVVFGPTGSGKTDVAMSLARAIDGEIVSADSMQIYRGLPITTNQSAPAAGLQDRRHLVGVIDPSEESSVARYAEMAQAAIDAVVARGRTAIVEGGSGLYVRAALGGLAFGVAPGAARRQLERLAADDPEGLARRLVELDPVTAGRIDLANPRRVVRALEAVAAQSGSPAIGQRGRLWNVGPDGSTRHEHRFFGLEPDRADLRRRLDARVDAMLAAGLVDEIRIVAGGPLSRTVSQAIGVAEILAYLDGTCTLDEAVARIKSRTHRLVRRQLTWMRRVPDASILPTSARSPDDLAREIGERSSS